MFVQEQWLGSLQPWPPSLTLQPWLGQWAWPRVHLCAPVVCPRQPLGASLLHQSVQFTRGTMPPALICCVWPEAWSLCVPGLLQHCWTINDIQVTSGSASDGLLQVSTSHRCCLTASVQMGITQSKTWVQKMMTKVSWSFQKHCKF